jgi:hypothetical protein
MATIVQIASYAIADLAMSAGMSGVHCIYDLAAFCLPWSDPTFRPCPRCYRSCQR